MAINRLNDATQDQSQLLVANFAVDANTSVGTTAFDLGTVDPCQFKVRLEWNWTAPAVTNSQRVVVVGGLVSNFSTGYWLLGQTSLGAADNIATDTGVSILGFRGSGKYVIECSNVGQYNDGTFFDFRTVNCRWIQVWFTGVGASSAGTATIRIDHR